MLHRLAPLFFVACVPAMPPAAHVQAHEVPPALDVDRGDLDLTAHALVLAESGTLLARIADEEPSDTTECDPGDHDARAHRSWDHGDTVLAALSPESSSNGTPGGWVGSVLPMIAGHSAVAVRSFTVDWATTELGERDDELIALGLADLRAEVIYTPGGRLRLLGVVARNALVLVSSRDGDGLHHVALVDPRGTELARSPAIEVPAEALAQSFTELGLPWAAPSGPAELVLPCEADGELCSVAVEGAALSLARIGVVLEDGLVLTESGPRVTREDECRELRADAGFEPCPEPTAAGIDSGLPVDGELADGAEGEVPRVEVRSGIALAPLVDEADATGDAERSETPGVVILTAPQGGAVEVGFDLLVRGDHLAISYTRVSDTSASTMRRDLGLALPARSVDARPISFGDAAGYRVRIASTFPIHYSHACWQGLWVVRAWFDEGGEAFATTYAEYGFCD